MDTARDKYTKRPVTGFDLKRFEFVDKEAYECLACEVPVNPVSFEKHHKRSPHFKLFAGTHHLSTCAYEKEERSYVKAENERISTPDGLPFPYPSRMVIRDDNLLEDGGDTNAENSDAKRKSSGGGRSSGQTSSRPHNYTVDTIRSLAQFYLRFPFDRDLPLTVPGIAGKTFNDVFQKLAFDEQRTYSERKIYFGSVHYQKSTINENFIEVKLTQGDWSVSPVVNQYRVRIDVSGWSELEKNAVADEINIIRDEIKAINDKNQKRQKKKQWNETIKGWLFFAGKQDDEDEFLFHVDNWRFISCVAGNFRQGNTPKARKNQSNSVPKQETKQNTFANSAFPLSSNLATDTSLRNRQNTVDTLKPVYKTAENTVRPAPKHDNTAGTRSEPRESLKTVNASPKIVPNRETYEPRTSENSAPTKIASWANKLWSKLFD